MPWDATIAALSVIMTCPARVAGAGLELKTTPLIAPSTAETPVPAIARLLASDAPFRSSAPPAAILTVLEPSGWGAVVGSNIGAGVGAMLGAAGTTTPPKTTVSPV